ncbi:amidase signature domain-containing protein [Aspergillus stella-maris]|uniref:amidase signature domain-containing protein n=1 Tax=Aspergillus stella-maris TaxID=1810926 RepID=UPI003CCCD231
MADLNSWQSIAQRKRDALDMLLPADFRLDSVPSAEEQQGVTQYIQQFLSAEEREITENHSAEALIGKLTAGTFSATEVTKAFCRRATIAHQLVNCLSEILFSQALARAQELDEYLRVHGKPVGPLHGLPISLKDQFRVKDAETSVGYVAWLGKVETEETESWVVQALKNMGAVIFAKTNVPTSLMAIETNNNIVGYTTNPHNRLLSSGGSSGGEAALLALRGSVLGLGSDIGTSIRLPCAFTGLTGLKPSHGRLPYLNVANSMEGQETVPSVIGPMGHSISDLRLLTQSILHNQPWLHDPKVIDIPWRFDVEDEVRQRAASKGLTFGVLRADGVVQPHPPITRAINETVQALNVARHEVIEWTPPSHSEAFEILWNTFAADSGADIHGTLQASGEPEVPQLAISYGDAPGHFPNRTITDLWALQRQKSDYQARYLRYWNATAGQTRSGRPVDAIIAPATPTASHKPSEGMYFGYTGVYNVLDFSAAVVAVTRADSTRDVKRDDYTPVGDLDAAVWKLSNPSTKHSRR